MKLYPIVILASSIGILTWGVLKKRSIQLEARSITSNSSTGILLTNIQSTSNTPQTNLTGFYYITIPGVFKIWKVKATDRLEAIASFGATVWREEEWKQVEWGTFLTNFTIVDLTTTVK